MASSVKNGCVFWIADPRYKLGESMAGLRVNLHVLSFCFILSSKEKQEMFLERWIYNSKIYCIFSPDPWQNGVKNVK